MASRWRRKITLGPIFASIAGNLAFPVRMHFKLVLKKKKKSYFLLPDNAAAAAKSLQSCPTLCDPIDCSPPGSPVPGILQARTLEWVAISFSNAGK